MFRFKNFILVLLGVFFCSQVMSQNLSDEQMKKLKEDFKRPDKIPYLENNPYSLKKEKLGQMLFFDPRLSGNNTISCSTCHNPSFHWTSANPLAVGFKHKILGRKDPSIINLAWYEKLMWDGRFTYLEGQVLGPITSEDEMNQKLDGDKGLIKKLSHIPEYVLLFKEAFPNEKNPLNAENIAKSIAIFERGIVSGESPFDRYINGDEKAISDNAKKGFVLFNTKGNCSSCHAGWNFSDGSFHDIGVKGHDLGRGVYLKLESQQYAFKTPGLRNIADQPYYMHNGSEKTLEEVVQFYNRGGDVKRPSLSADIKPLNLTQQEVSNIVEFMNTLSSVNKIKNFPILPK